MSKGVCTIIGSRFLTGCLAIVSAVLLVASLRLPLWHMRLEAPQYRDEEALKISVYPNKMGGDLRELKVLNQYIGVHVPPTLSQFRWLPGVVIATGVLGIVAGFLPISARSKAFCLVAGFLTCAVVLAALQARWQMHDIGHHRDAHTILVGVHDFTPPFLGTTRIAQFTVSSRFGVGAWLIAGALLGQVAAAWVSRKSVAVLTARHLTNAKVERPLLVRSIRSDTHSFAQT